MDRLAEAQQRLAVVEAKLAVNRRPFEGEIVGGNVQLSYVGEWRASRRGQAWSRRNDTLMREYIAARDKLAAAQHRHDREQSTIAAGGPEALRLREAHEYLTNARESGPPQADWRIGNAMLLYRARYNQARKAGVDISGYTMPERRAVGKP
jgi:hypothetical protein